MINSLRALIFIGGLVIIMLGLVIMLLINESGETPEALVSVVTWLNFLVGGLLIFYMVKRKGIH